jgi:membrane fusion protein, multidrug efflux system
VSAHFGISWINIISNKVQSKYVKETSLENYVDTLERKTMKISAIPISLILTLSLLACEKPADQVPPPRPALVAVVGDATAMESADIVLVGEVKSRYESNQSFRIAGKIISRQAEVGDVVKKGQALAKIDATDSQLSAQAAKADVLVAQANYALAKTEVERQRQLLEKKFISQSALDRQEAQLETAAASLKQAQAQAAVANNQSRYTTLTADRDGIITQINAEPGQVVQAGELIVQIVDTKQIEVLAAVPESRMDDVHVNDLVAIKLWANQAKNYKGKVREITPAASEATRAFDMRVAVLDTDEKVKFGMTAGVIVGNKFAQGIIVPSSAVTQYEGQNIVWVIDDKGIVSQRKVEIGSFTENGVAILKGLSAGEMVAIAGVHTLVNGQKVKPQIEKNELAS